MFKEKSYLSSNSNGQHQITYSDYGPEKGRVLICVHGLTGNGHDFKIIAPHLVQQGYRVIAVDMPGRGRSDFLSNPDDYNYGQYIKDLMGLFAGLNITEAKSIDWLGVSMGGLLGIHMASLPSSPIARLILNDIGPAVPQDALDFIYTVIKEEYHFANMADFKQRLINTRGLTWGPMDDVHWTMMADDNAKILDNRKITYAYDPAIAQVFNNEPIGAVDLWPCWQALDIPILLLRGENSVLLTQDIVDQMKESQPNLSFHEIKKAGHVPSLMQEDQIEIVVNWLSHNNQSN